MLLVTVCFSQEQRGLLSNHSITFNMLSVLGVWRQTVKFLTLLTGVNPLQYVSGCWERKLTAILGYPVCSLRLKGPMLYEIFPFCSIHHNDRSLAMTLLSYFNSG